MNKAAPAPKVNMGQPVVRTDAKAKVTGAARYASDFPVANPAYAYLVTSAIARGKIEKMDLSKAKAVSGLLHIMTHENAKPLGKVEFFSNGGQLSTTILPLVSSNISHDGEIIAVVVAETYEAAREAANKVEVQYDEETPSASLQSNGVTSEEAAKASAEHKDPVAGDIKAGLAAGDAIVEAEYTTPAQHHNPIELFSTTCVWNGDDLTVYEPSQFVAGLSVGVAKQLEIDRRRVRVISPFIGGAFGAKGSMTPRTALIAQLAKQLGRPVKLVMTRDQGFTVTTYRAETKHQIKLGATKDGKLTAYSHESWELTSRPDGYFVGGNKNSAVMYACPNVWTKANIVHADRNTPGFMRAPAEVPYIYALETAMDELAVKLNMDPIELRRINDTQKSPINGAPYTSRSLMQCYDEASKAFGWEKRSAKPSSMRDGDWLIGWGCATATYPTQHNPAAVRVRLSADGQARVQVAAHDVGTGAYTVIAQQAAMMLAVPVEKIEVQLGDSELPPGPVAGGSVTTASVCSVVMMACDAINAKLFGPDKKPSDGQTRDYKKAFEQFGKPVIEEYAEWVPKGAKPGALKSLYNGSVAIGGGPTDEKLMFAFGAEFVEVRINEKTREIRVPRIVGAFAAGRIANPRTARSQLMGGMIWGIGSALHEFTEIDERAARYVNDNIAEYLIPVNADIPSVEVIMLSEVDNDISPSGMKGLGELGNVGTAAAISNAVFHATGIRIRDLPITLDKLHDRIA